MTLYQLRATQALPITMEKAWKFLSDPANLQKITPPKMGFEILSGADREMYPGQIIQYTVRPFAGIATRWVTEITHVREGSYFVDEQRFGPYALWHHKHFIEPLDEGILMEDIIDYKIPFGSLGSFFHNPIVKKQLTSIFNYREKALTDFFGRIPDRPAAFEIIKI